MPTVKQLEVDSDAKVCCIETKATKAAKGKECLGGSLGPKILSLLKWLMQDGGKHGKKHGNGWKRMISVYVSKSCLVGISAGML